MKSSIHPDYGPVVIRDRSANQSFLTRSTLVASRPEGHPTVERHDGRVLPVVDVQISSGSHPFWTGRSRTIDAEGRVEKFNRRYGRKQTR
ncbi:type B 50S ribosomal protein L31 [Luteococcus sp. Sow4_B9]|uniref:type B 50S ribosomal protein L31 n=1 Tax=Luteococcus sp. Sow4_B9 TaxID=3438792 RepID=UPI003F96520D